MVTSIYSGGRNFQLGVSKLISGGVLLVALRRREPGVNELQHAPLSIWQILSAIVKCLSCFNEG